MRRPAHRRTGRRTARPSRRASFRPSRRPRRRRLSLRRGMSTLEVVLVTGLMFPAIALITFLGIRVCRVFFSVVGVMTGSPYM